MIFTKKGQRYETVDIHIYLEVEWRIWTSKGYMYRWSWQRIQ